MVIGIYLIIGLPARSPAPQAEGRCLEFGYFSILPLDKAGPHR